MAYADPQSVTVSGTAISLPRTGSSLTSGTFGSPDGATVLTVSHQIGKRVRRAATLTINKVVPDAITPSVNTPVNMSVSIVVNAPKTGFATADQVAAIVALADWLKASTNANATRLIGAES